MSGAKPYALRGRAALQGREKRIDVTYAALKRRSSTLLANVHRETLLIRAHLHHLGQMQCCQLFLDVCRDLAFNKLGRYANGVLDRIHVR
jgi:hypothetical protein